MANNNDHDNNRREKEKEKEKEIIKHSPQKKNCSSSVIVPG
jgi:hypothetical protein